MQTTFISMSMFEWMTISLSVLMLLFGSGILIGLIKVIAIGQDMRTTLNILMSNHLPHIQNEIKEVREMFVQHLEDTNGRH